MLFRAGIDRNNPSLRIDGQLVNQFMQCPDNTHLMIQVDTLERTMKVFSMKNDEEWDEICYDSFCSETTVDLAITGERWEGPSLHSCPFGYGSLYDSSNKLVYRGFIFDTIKVCFGCVFYGDLGMVEYEGNICQNMRHGFGRCYSRKGECLYDGKWIDDSPVDHYIIHTEVGCEDTMKFHTLVEEAIIGENSFNACNITQIVLTDYLFLRKLMIGSNSFKKCSSFLIHALPKLEYLCICDNSFCGDSEGSFIVSDSPLLGMICVGDYSFSSFSLFNIYSICSKYV